MLLVATAALGAFFYKKTSDALELARHNLATTTEAKLELAQKLASTTDELHKTEQDRNSLGEQLNRERERNDNFQNQIDQLTGTVGKLDKLSQTDPELLKKYSRVYFLNENYMPANLKQLSDQYVYNKDKPEFLKKEVIPFFVNMVEDAMKDNVDLLVDSAFRSFDTQAALKGEYLQTYGSGSNTFSADQGYSEHQLGTTIDFTTPALDGNLDGFDQTKAYTWLQKNAYKYGFEMSYPQNNNYYVFEPWHWRFVGIKLATDLHDADASFYDWDQRQIDTYLIDLFDNG